MKVFGLIAILLVVASCFAWALLPKVDQDGRTHIIWATDDGPTHRADIDLFNQMNPDCLLEIDPSNSGEMEKVMVQATAGVGPDIFDAATPSELAAFVRAGVAWDITDELAKRNIDIRKECWPALLPDCIDEGRVYGIAANVATDVLFFNKDIFDQMHLSYPKGPMTWQQFIPLAEKLMIRDSGGHVVRYGFTYNYEMWKGFLVQWGARIYSPDGTACVLDSPPAIAAMQFQWDLIYKWKVMPSPAEEEAESQQGGWGNGAQKMFSAGRTATALGGRWWLCTMRNYDGLKLGACESPHGPLRVFSAYGRSALVNKHSPRREQALKVLLHLRTEAYNHQLNLEADGLGPMIQYCSADSLDNPRYPNEDFNRVFLDQLNAAVPEDTTPFVNSVVAERIFNTQLDLIRRNAKSPEQGMREMASQVNAEIQKTLARDPELKARYDAVVKGVAQ